ncbi:MAG: MBL fold metallo-hydrolase [Thermomicrobiales bacterium]|nr:MBL fold metallo-hydrolase [Thermomicrobiales bacterium]
MTWEWRLDDAVIDRGNGLWQIDLGFQDRREIISAWLYRGSDSWALIETGPSSTLDHLNAALGSLGISITDIGHILLTHIHLDHAGAAGLLAQANPDATVYVHPFGAPHLIDPSKLIASATRIYTDQMDSLWGTILPIPEQQVVQYEDGQVVDVADRRLQILFTPGHAWHHVALFDLDSRDLFTGDVAGIRMPGRDYICPPTPPPDLDPDSWRASIAAMQALRPKRLGLAHFGMFDDAEGHLARIEPALDVFLKRGEESFAAGEAQDILTVSLHDLMARDVDAADPEVLQSYELATPSYMAAMGLTRLYRKQAEKAASVS